MIFGSKLRAGFGFSGAGSFGRGLGVDQLRPDGGSAGASWTASFGGGRGSGL